MGKREAHEVRVLQWEHPDAVMLREGLTLEVAPRYAQRLAGLSPAGQNAQAVDPQTVHSTFVVYIADHAVGHVALRWNWPASKFLARALDDGPGALSRAKNFDRKPNAGELELKRMFVAAGHRGSGVAQALLTAAEEAVRAAGLRRVILQTGDKQPDAVRFYEKQGYHRIPLFPPYLEHIYSNCFAKEV